MGGRFILSTNSYIAGMRIVQAGQANTLHVFKDAVDNLNVLASPCFSGELANASHDVFSFDFERVGDLKDSLVMTFVLPEDALPAGECVFSLFIDNVLAYSDSARVI